MTGQSQTMIRAFWQLTMLIAGINLALTGAVQAQAVELVEDRIYLTVTVNGLAVEALLDSSARRSMVSPELARRLSAKKTGISESRRWRDGEFIQSVNLAVAEVELPRRTLAVADLRELPSRSSATPVAMVLGRELFDSQRVALNLPEQTLSVVSREARPSGQLLPLRQSKGSIQVPLQIEDLRRVWANLGFGSQTEVLLSRQYALYNALHEPERIVGQTTGAGLRGRVSRDLVVLNEITIAEQRFSDIIATIDSAVDAAEVSIGTALLRDSVITIDLAERKLWLAEEVAVESVRELENPATPSAATID